MSNHKITYQRKFAQPGPLWFKPSFSPNAPGRARPCATPSIEVRPKLSCGCFVGKSSWKWKGLKRTVWYRMCQWLPIYTGFSFWFFTKSYWRQTGWLHLVWSSSETLLKLNIGVGFGPDTAYWYLHLSQFERHKSFCGLRVGLWEGPFLWVPN